MENITSIPNLWPDCWHVYTPSISFVRLPFYICSGAGLLTSGTRERGSGAVMGTLRTVGGGGVIISPWFNYVSLQTPLGRFIAQVKMCDASAVPSSG